MCLSFHANNNSQSVRWLPVDSTNNLNTTIYQTDVMVLPLNSHNVFTSAKQYAKVSEHVDWLMWLPLYANTKNTKPVKHYANLNGDFKLWVCHWMNSVNKYVISDGVCQDAWIIYTTITPSLKVYANWFDVKHKLTKHSILMTWSETCVGEHLPLNFLIQFGILLHCFISCTCSHIINIVLAE